MLEKREFEKNDFLWRVSTAVMVVSGFFSVIVFALLVINYLQFRAADPVNDPMITQMRQQYATQPQKDEALAVRIRALELINRKALFTTMTQIQVGSGLLFAGVVVFMISFKYSIRWQREKPELEEVPTADKEFLALAQSRQMIMWTGVGILAVGMASAILTQSNLSKVGAMAPAGPGDAVAASGESTNAGPTTETAVATLEPPKWDVMEKNWPSFRGPGSLGVAYFKTAPTDWDVESGKNIKWKVEAGLSAPNSPVVWNGRIFFSGANETAREVYCYNADDGKQIWKQTVENLGPAGEEPPKVSEDTGFAAPSMVAHGGQVFAIFADGDVVSYDMDGKKVWAITFGVPENHYGHSSSLLAYDKFLYVQLDQSTNPRLIALNIADGKEAWTAQRQTISWASPIMAQTSMGQQLILNSETTVDAYDPLTGAPLWSQECLSGEVAPSPAYNNGIVFAAQEYATAAAIQLEKGDSGIAPKILWEYDELLPEISSPVGDGERFYFGTASGIFVCLDAKTGEKLWEHEFEDAFHSSPVVVGDRIYAADIGGNLHIVQASSTFNLIASHNMGGPVHATPAFMDGRIYVRTENQLICIEQANA
ncbi:MAG: PQQ-binding-like beta-propeller repeat protein [Candidatus Hydrogenedentes bacterium]|nr:PQQ-binding-like beta-propeller repeat protein [Candidatus Hydrogenedentota bacterium]